MRGWFTVVIPTRDSAGWIGALLAHYAARRVVPVLLVDRRTTDATAEIAAQAGVRVVGIDGFTFTEAIVGVTATCVETPWALFMHDDEVPSDALFARLAGPAPPDAAQSVAIPRRWAWCAPGVPLTYGVGDRWPDRTGRPGSDHHWRLFKPDQVRFVDVMHSEGFVIDRWARFGADEYFVHFEWVIRTLAHRQAKLRRYDIHRYGYGRFFEAVYLPEMQPAGAIAYLPFGTTAFDALAAAYHRNRAGGDRDPGPTLAERVALWRSRLRFAFDRGLHSAEPRDRAGLTPRPENEIQCDPDGDPVPPPAL